jgi:hypothetical protein
MSTAKAELKALPGVGCSDWLERMFGAATHSFQADAPARLNPFQSFGGWRITHKCLAFRAAKNCRTRRKTPKIPIAPPTTAPSNGVFVSNTMLQIPQMTRPTMMNVPPEITVATSHRGQRPLASENHDDLRHSDDSNPLPQRGLK